MDHFAQPDGCWPTNILHGRCVEMRGGLPIDWRAALAVRRFYCVKVGQTEGRGPKSYPITPWALMSRHITEREAEFQSNISGGIAALTNTHLPDQAMDALSAHLGLFDGPPETQPQRKSL